MDKERITADKPAPTLPTDPTSRYGQDIIEELNDDIARTQEYIEYMQSKRDGIHSEICRAEDLLEYSVRIRDGIRSADHKKGTQSIKENY